MNRSGFTEPYIYKSMRADSSPIWGVASANVRERTLRSLFGLGWRQVWYGNLRLTRIAAHETIAREIDRRWHRALPGYECLGPRSCVMRHQECVCTTAVAVFGTESVWIWYCLWWWVVRLAVDVVRPQNACAVVVAPPPLAVA
jgi:hypothetical protein